MDGVAGWFEKRGEIPLVPPPRFREYGPLRDDPDRPDADFSDMSVRGVAFAMEYCDQHGWMSTRTVRCLALDPRPPACLRAFCHVRGTSRTFRIDRIISVVDLRSGAILPGDAHVALLAPYLPQHRHEPEISAMRDLLDAAASGVFALLQIAMAEGRLGDREREVVLDYVAAEAAALQVPFPTQAAVELWVDNLAPPLDTVVAAVVRLLSEKDKLVRLLPSFLKLVRSREGGRQEQSIRDLIAEIRLHYRRKPLEWPGSVKSRAGGP
jgi:hypothetical protein